MSETIVCPVCLNAEGLSCKTFSGFSLECDICGRYRMDYALWEQARAGKNKIGHWALTSVQRAVLSHRIRTKTSGRPANESDVLLITPDLLDSLRSNALLPSPTAQADNLVRFVGERVSQSGEPIERFPYKIHAIIGSLNRTAAVRLINELAKRGTLTSVSNSHYQTESGEFPWPPEPAGINLSLDGWAQYESQKQGGFEGNYGFIAMQFNESDLDDFVQHVVKPAVKTATGYDLVDMRDVPTAGIIDNIMRIKIKEARFVIADLTHDNNGAYWEAGYAEGLGKSVIYICEQKKFDKKKSHFDTNHCTTVPWSTDDPETFRQRLSATLRRSLYLSG